MSTKTSGQGYPGQQGANDSTTDYNSVVRIVEQVLSRVRTAVIVQIQAVHVDAAGLAPVGFADAVPLVKQMDGGGNTFVHGTVFNLPYFRLQGGANAVIIDPAPGDIGVALICDRDISSVKSTKAAASPGSRRRYSLPDGLYLGGFLNAKPICRIYFNPPGGPAGMTMTPDDGVTFLKIEPGKITLNAAEIISHATTKNVFDADGTGFVYTASQIDTYTDGVTTNHHAPTPPEVPT